MLKVAWLDRTLFIGLKRSSGKDRERHPQGTQAGANVIEIEFI